MRSQALASILLSVLAAPALAESGDGGYGHPHMFGGYGWGYMMMGPIMMILFLAVVVVLVVLLVRWLGGAGPSGIRHHPPENRPLTILKERFARGEIDKEEFEERRGILGE